MVDAELSEEGGGKVGLVAKDIDTARGFDGTSCPNHGNVVFARVELVDVGRPRHAMVGKDDDEGVLPLRRATECFQEAGNRMVEVVEGVEDGVFQRVVRHFPRFVAGEGEEGLEPRPTLRHSGDALRELAEHEVVGHAPNMGVAHRLGEVGIAQNTVVACGEEVGVHVGEVLVASVEKLRVVAHALE